MLENMLSKEELDALLKEHGEETLTETHVDPRLETGEKDKLLHAVVRNQLRLLRMIDELQAEVHSLRSQVVSAPSSSRGLASMEAAASKQLVPLPFMERKAEAEVESQPRQQESAQLSRKERFKRNSIW